MAKTGGRGSLYGLSLGCPARCRLRHGHFASRPTPTQAVGVVASLVFAISHWEAALSAKSMRGSISLQQLADEQPVSVAPASGIGLGCGRRPLTPPNVTATSLTPWKNDPCDANSPKPPAVSGLPAFWR